MGKQLLFCIETNKKTGTDSVYINETIDKYYVRENTISIKFIPLSGKSNYKKPGTLKEISSKRKQYSRNGETTVIYCIDTDKYDLESEQKILLDEIVRFCDDMGFELVLFCRDVEDVYWGEQVSKSDKVAMAGKFRSSRHIDNVPEEVLKSAKIRRHKSNILDVLDKVLDRKQEN